MTGWMSSSHLQTEDWTTDISLLQSAADDWLDVVQPPTAETWTTDILLLQSAADDWLDVVQPPADRGLDN